MPRFLDAPSWYNSNGDLVSRVYQTVVLFGYQSVSYVLFTITSQSYASADVGVGRAAHVADWTAKFSYFPRMMGMCLSNLNTNEETLKNGWGMWGEIQPSSVAVRRIEGSQEHDVFNVSASEVYLWGCYSLPMSDFT